MFWIMKKGKDLKIKVCDLDFKDNKEYMLKSMRNRGAGREEFEILSGLDHENVIQYTASELFEFERCQFFGIFMPFYDGGDMQSYIEGHLERNNTKWKGGERFPLVYISQLIYGLSYLHENGLIHRDIKPSNLFRTTWKRLVIGDFDIAGESLLLTRINKKMKKETRKRLLRNDTKDLQSRDGALHAAGSFGQLRGRAHHPI